MVNPEQTTMVDNPNIGVTLEVPPSTAMDSEGNEYSGPLSIASVPVEATPRELPEAFSPSFIITIQPTGIQFNTPVAITFPNTDNHPPGSVVEIFSLSERGGFESVGFAEVSSDGQTVRTISGGVRSASWHFITVVEPKIISVAIPDTGDGENNDEDPITCEGSRLCLSTGSLSEEHDFPRFVSHSTPIFMKMGYKNPTPTRSLELEGGSEPTLMTTLIFKSLRIRLNASNQNLRFVRPVVPTSLSVTYSVDEVKSQKTFFDISDFAGIYDVPIKLIKSLHIRGVSKTSLRSLKVSVGLGDSSLQVGSTRTVDGEFFYPVISSDTEFGKGWRFQGLQRLYGKDGDPNKESEKIMLVYGNFKFLVFTKKEKISQ